MTTILIFGKDGQLGRELNALLAQQFDVVAVASREADLRKPDELKEVIRAESPQLIVNAAAYTAVDKAESDRDTAFAVNALAPAVIAEEAARSGAGLIHFSTDFVFDGTSEKPYVETDQTNPINIYGESKLAGERAIIESSAAAIIFRTSWLYGLQGVNFLLTMSRLLTERDRLSVVDDQTGSPTSVYELAETVCAILPAEESALAQFTGLHRGVYHLSCEGQATWFEFADKIRTHLAMLGRRVADVAPVTTAEYPTPAARPSYSVLDKAKFRRTFCQDITNWKPALASVLQRMQTD